MQRHWSLLRQHHADEHDLFVSSGRKEKMKGIPRIRGKIGQCVESDDRSLIGKWFFDLYLTTLGGGEGYHMGQFGPFETEKIAQDELMNASKIACEEVEKSLTGESSGEYIDMKDNKRKAWPERPVSEKNNEVKQ